MQPYGVHPNLEIKFEAVSKNKKQIIFLVADKFNNIRFNDFYWCRKHFRFWCTLKGDILFMKLVKETQKVSKKFNESMEIGGFPSVMPVI